jgi:hypothetical protein
VDADGVGTGVGGAVVGGLVCCGVGVCCGVAVRRRDGVTTGAGERCGVRRGTGRGLCDGAGAGALVCGPVAGESPAALGVGGLTHR